MHPSPSRRGRCGHTPVASTFLLVMSIGLAAGCAQTPAEPFLDRRSILPVRDQTSAPCKTNVRPVTPAAALAQGIAGVVRARMRIEDGRVADVEILSGPEVFHATVRETMMMYDCSGLKGSVIAVQEFSFMIYPSWRR